MQNMMVKVKLIFDKGEMFLNLNYTPLTEIVVNLKPIVEDLNKGCLLIRRHDYLQTQFIMTGAGSCIMMIFDEKGKHVSTRYHDGEATGPFSAFISELFVLILPQGYFLLDQLLPLSLELLFPAPSLLCKNRFGVYEPLDEQCGKSCICNDGCKLDDMIFEESYLLDAYKANMRKAAERTKKKNDLPPFNFKVMESINIQRSGDNDVIRNYKKSFEGHTLETLIKAYNKHARLGFVRGHLQALFLIALNHEFVERMISSPIYYKDHILGMKGEVEIVDGELRVKES